MTNWLKPAGLFLATALAEIAGCYLPWLWINGRARVPRGSLFIPFFDQRLLVNDLTLGEIDPISKEPDYKKCAAAVGKVSQAAATKQPALSL